MGAPHSGIRWKEDIGWEVRCGECNLYWPLDDEFWNAHQGMGRCRACHRERRNARDRANWKTHPERRARELAEQREYNALARRVISFKKARYYAARRDEITAKARRNYAANRATIRRRQNQRRAERMRKAA